MSAVPSSGSIPTIATYGADQPINQSATISGIFIPGNQHVIESCVSHSLSTDTSQLIYTSEQGLGCSNCHWTGCYMCTPSAIKQRYINNVDKTLKECPIVIALQDKIKVLEQKIQELSHDK